MIDITPIIEAVIALILAIVSAFLIPLIRTKVSAKTLEEILKWVDIAVAAAEQIYDSDRGDEKKVYVLKFLEKMGYMADDVVVEAIDNAIEASVIKLHNEIRKNADN